MDEEVLIRNAINGNKPAFSQLVSKYQGYVFSVCFGILKNYHDAENTAQETFVAAYFSLHQYQSKGFKNWIGKIAMRKAIDCYRLRAKVPEVTLGDRLNAIASNALSDEIIENEFKQQINALCNQLPDIYRTVILKYYFH